MLSITYSAAPYGADGYEVIIECTSRKALPMFEIVGLPAAAIVESERRIFTGSENSGISIPPSEITINLAPADKKKDGTAIELAMLTKVTSSNSSELHEAKALILTTELGTDVTHKLQ